MWRPAHGATSRPGPCRPASGYGRELGRPGPRVGEAPAVEPGTRCPATRSSSRRSRSAASRPTRRRRPLLRDRRQGVGEPGRTGAGARHLGRHQLGEIALDLHLALHERLHPGLRVAADEDVAGGHVVGGEREVGVGGVAGVPSRRGRPWRRCGAGGPRRRACRSPARFMVSSACGGISSSCASTISRTAVNQSSERNGYVATDRHRSQAGATPRLDAMSRLTRADVEHVAQLARLALTDDEIEQLHRAARRDPRARRAGRGARHRRRAAHRAPACRS